MREVPEHLRPDSCYICGGAKHPETDHAFWSNTDAEKEFREAYPRRGRYSYNEADTPEAAYVAEHRPY